MRIPTQSGRGFRFEAGHLGRSRPHRLLPAVQQLRHSCFVDDRRGDWDAGEAGTEHATIATSIATSPRWGERPRDRAASGRGAQHDPGQSETGGGGRAEMAVGRRRQRGASGTPALWARWDCDRPAAAGRAARELKRPGVTMMILWEEY